MKFANFSHDVLEQNGHFTLEIKAENDKTGLQTKAGIDEVNFDGFEIAFEGQKPVFRR